MRFLFGELLAGAPILWAPIVALIIFIAVFAVALARVLRRPARAYDAVARLPLDEEVGHE